MLINQTYSTRKFAMLIVSIMILGVSSVFFLHWNFGEQKSEQGDNEIDELIISPIISTEKERYYQGDPIEVDIALNNDERIMVQLNHIEYNLTILKNGKNIYSIKTCHEFTCPLVFEPNTVYWMPLSQTWKQIDLMNKQVPEGNYTIKLTLLPYNLTASKIITIEPIN